MAPGYSSGSIYVHFVYYISLCKSKQLILPSLHMANSMGGPHIRAELDRYNFLLFYILNILLLLNLPGVITQSFHLSLPSLLHCYQQAAGQQPANQHLLSQEAESG